MNDALIYLSLFFFFYYPFEHILIIL